VISNIDPGPGTPPYTHKRVHVWQNRIFGPLYTLTYLAWLVALFVPGIIAGLLCGVSAGARITGYSYYNNPQEARAYRIGHQHGGSARTDRSLLKWSDGVVLVASVLFSVALIGMTFFTVLNV